ncbi:MAG: L,D-transpeptidase [Propionibacteriaceae bacterium]|nr:L,D-transpeptidase [Propionibacteriaceae bacterium]
MNDDTGLPTLPHRSPKKKWLIAAVPVLLLAIALAVGGVTYLSRDQTLAVSGVTVGGADVGGLTYDEIVQKTTALVDEWAFTVALGDHSETASAWQLGIAPDAQTAAHAALETSAALTWFQWLNPFRSIPVPLTTTVDRQTLQSYLTQTFPETNPVVAQEPEVTYDPELGSWTVTPGVPGQGAAAASVLPTLLEQVRDGQPGRVSVTVDTVTPIVSDAEANATAAELNRRINTLPSLSVAGHTVYTITAADFADWVRLTPDGVHGGFRIGFDEGRITTALDNKLAETLTQEAEPEVQLRDASGNQTLAIAGQEGWALASTTQAAALIATALDAGESAVLELPGVITAPEVKIADIGPVHPGAHWADVNLTTQTLTLFDGATPIKTIWISSGKPETPTPQGSHPVASGQKSLNATLRGSDFYYEHVVWVGWNNMYGVHSAYWHGNFGRPQSHGCVNVSPDEIMDVYNWLAAGDYIEVHE